MVSGAGSFQSYMLYQGKKFVQRFDANTYLRIIDMWSRHDAANVRAMPRIIVIS